MALIKYSGNIFFCLLQQNLLLNNANKWSNNKLLQFLY
jgi:hypothetical protein